MSPFKYVLSRLRADRLYRKLSICIFGIQEMEFLSFILKAGKLAMNQRETD